MGPAGNPFPEAYVFPGRGGDELLQLLMIHTQPGRHRLHRLALAVEHQPAQIQLTGAPLIRPWQFAEHLGGESHQTRPDLGHLLWSHEPSQDHTTGHKPGSDTPNKALLGARTSSRTHRVHAPRSWPTRRPREEPPEAGHRDRRRAGTTGRRPAPPPS